MIITRHFILYNVKNRKSENTKKKVIKKEKKSRQRSLFNCQARHYRLGSSKASDTKRNVEASLSKNAVIQAIHDLIDIRCIIKTITGQ